VPAIAYMPGIQFPLRDFLCQFLPYDF
jgi:hypothetical protein